MNRRSLFASFFKLILVAMPFSSRLLKAFAPSLTEKFVLIYDSRLPRLFSDRLIDKADAILRSWDSRWMDKLVRLDIATQSQAVNAFIVKYGANTKTVPSPILVAVPENFVEEGEVALWTTELINARDKNEIVCYPISSNWWSVEGDWNPSIKKVRDHLFKSPNHKDGVFVMDWLMQLQFEELQSLHSDHHREMTKKGMVQWHLVNYTCPR